MQKDYKQHQEWINTAATKYNIFNLSFAFPSISGWVIWFSFRYKSEFAYVVRGILKRNEDEWNA